MNTIGIALFLALPAASQPTNRSEALKERQVQDNRQLDADQQGRLRQLKEAIDGDDLGFTRRARRQRADFEAALRQERKDFDASLKGKTRDEIKNAHLEFGDRQNEEKLDFKRREKKTSREFYISQRSRMAELKRLEKEERRILDDRHRAEREAAARQKELDAKPR